MEQEPLDGTYTSTELFYSLNIFVRRFDKKQGVEAAHPNTHTGVDVGILTYQVATTKSLCTGAAAPKAPLCKGSCRRSRLRDCYRSIDIFMATRKKHITKAYNGFAERFQQNGAAYRTIPPTRLRRPTSAQGTPFGRLYTREALVRCISSRFFKFQLLHSTTSHTTMMVLLG